MDLSTLASAGLSTTAILILYGIYRLCLVVIGRRFVSHCCEREVRVGINVEDFTPPSAHQSRSQTHLHQHLHSVGFQTPSRNGLAESHSEPLLLRHQESRLSIDTLPSEQDEAETLSLESTASSSVLSKQSTLH